MAKEKNFTLRIDARLLDTFLTVCRKQDQVASAVVRESMRAHIREWRRRCRGLSGYINSTDIADDESGPRLRAWRGQADATNSGRGRGSR